MPARSRDIDDYGSQARYRSEVERSFAFAGVKHDLFIKAKAAALLELVARRLGDPRERTFLDVGCGVGSMQTYVGPHAKESHGVDVSAQSVAEAARAHPGSRLLAYDGETLPFDDARFDVAFAVNVVHHVAPSRWPSFARELVRVVKPGGLAVVFEHNPYNPLTRLAVFRCAFDADAVLLTKRKARALLVGAGARVVEQRYILFFPVDHAAARRAEVALRSLPMGAQYYVAVTPST